MALQVTNHIGFMGRRGSIVLPPNAWIGATNSTTNTTNYTFSSASLGTAHAARYIIVGVVTVATSARTISSATIGGVSATLNYNPSSTNAGRLICAAVPSGATGDIVINHSGACTSCAIGVWAAYDLTSATAHDTGAVSIAGDNVTISLDVPASQTIRYAAMVQNGVTATVSGATSRARANSESFYDYFFFDYLATSAETPHDATWTEIGESLPSQGGGASHN